MTRKYPITGSASRPDSPLMNSAPMPLQAKMRSVMIAPPNRAAMSSGTTVASGIRALRNACRVVTTRSERPLARAVRM
ncbi:hypothetical protein D3C75_1344620 [compost metagenome]